jgi:hypothetical protein
MFVKKKHSWSWLALGSLLVSGIIYWVSRLFLRSVEKQSDRSAAKKKPKKSGRGSDELFI